MAYSTHPEAVAARDKRSRRHIPGLTFNKQRGRGGRWMAYKGNEYIGTYKKWEDGAEAMELGKRTDKAEEMTVSDKSKVDEHYSEVAQKHLGAKW